MPFCLCSYHLPLSTTQEERNPSRSVLCLFGTLGGGLVTTFFPTLHYLLKKILFCPFLLTREALPVVFLEKVE